MRTIFVIILVTVMSPCILAESKDEVYRVVRVHKDEQDMQNQIVINGGEKHGITENMLFSIYRKQEVSDPYAELQATEENREAGWSAEKMALIEIARVRSYRVYERVANARIESISDGFELDTLEYPVILEGDYVVPLKISVARINQLTEVFSYFDADLFDMGTYKVRSEIYDAFSKMADVLKSYRGGKIIIEGHVDRSGDRAENRKKSLTKAEVIKAFLVSELGLDEETILCIGYGEDDLVTRSTIGSEVRKNNRVIIKFVKM